MTTQDKINSLFQTIIFPFLLGIGCALMALLLKYITEYSESNLYDFLRDHYHGLLIVAAPAAGLLLIYLMNRFVFQGPASKGISELIEITKGSFSAIKLSKIFSHFFAGLFTIASGDLQV